MKIVVTGGAGYIGSHTVLELLNAGHEVVAVDNLVNSKIESLLRVEALTGRKVHFHQVDLLDEPGMDQVFSTHQIDAVIHFAALKAVGESVRMPLEYYHNNLTGLLTLCRVMQKHAVSTLVFSSSATVYGPTDRVPLVEDAPLTAINPYGWSKVMAEQILRDLHAADSTWRIAILRYFNPVGAHESGRIGEDPNGTPNNLFPYISQVAVGRRRRLQIFGGDYVTPDGTGVRDYVHVVDLAVGHLRALEALCRCPALLTYNLGTGRGYSVLEVLHAFEKACGRSVPYLLVDRRPGDVAISYADPSRAAKDLGWTADKDIDRMCEDAWRWQLQNPDGYQDSCMSGT